jgi:hypothetical protein
VISLRQAQAHVENFLTSTADARLLSEKCRDYYDGKQWTSQEKTKLQSRGQAPIVVNRVRPKVEGLCGLYNLRKTDPKAYPRTQKHEDAAHAVTDALRFVADANDFDDLRIEVAGDFFVEGYGGAIVDVRQKRNGEIVIHISQIPWDRIYFDPHSRKKDFSDARYKGVMLWMDADEVKEKFRGVDIDKLVDAGEYTDETFEDRPQWVDKTEGGKIKRIRLALHYYIDKGAWHMCVFAGGAFVAKPRVSPFLDDEGEPICPIELVSANIDRDNARYGEVQSFLDQQDEINHRRSKFLHSLSSRQTFGRKGAPDDVLRLKRELAKVDGHVEFLGEQWGKDFGIIPTSDMSKAQLDLYLDSKGELDAVSFNAQLSGDRQMGNLSGKAIDRLQQAGTIELNRQYGALSGWENRVYRQIWARVKQFWTEEKWIRVTDDQDNLRWAGFNVPVTAQEKLEEIVNDESRDARERQQAAQMYTALMQAQDPRLQQLVEVQNEVAELDVDIIVDQSFDVINVEREQFQLLAQFAQGGDVDILDLIELSEIRGKDELIEKIEKRRAQAAQMQGNAAQIDAQKKQAESTKVEMEAARTEQEAIQKKLENELVATQPERITSVAL